MRELRSLGSVRGVSGNRYSYRDPRPVAALAGTALNVRYSGQRPSLGSGPSNVAPQQAVIDRLLPTRAHELSGGSVAAILPVPALPAVRFSN